ncbi:hypothetical protein D915_007300 [Fasciola hepatica]|uniref:Uncharacterized protein n=1 Tax=Fasciola hepatica TaxID=6192 RepID=A0A4E0R272_FASHE|nr:hypothetical protein D915_007300 [Fasciola hepatica]
MSSIKSLLLDASTRPYYVLICNLLVVLFFLSVAFLSDPNLLEPNRTPAEWASFILCAGALVATFLVLILLLTAVFVLSKRRLLNYSVFIILVVDLVFAMASYILFKQRLTADETTDPSSTASLLAVMTTIFLSLLLLLIPIANEPHCRKIGKRS